jgi:hypothetical protein
LLLPASVDIPAAGSFRSARQNLPFPLSGVLQQPEIIIIPAARTVRIKK